jgi:primosomal protein N'
MPSNRYIQVILPLRLDWMPWYSTDIETIAVGDRVSLRFAGRHYSGVVAGVSDTPDIESERVLPIDRLETGLERISPQEIELWKFIADYYMCSIGEVFKTAYPMQRIEKEQTALRTHQRREAQIQRAADAVNARLERAQKRLDKCLLQLQGRHNEAITANLESTRSSLEQAISEFKRQLAEYEELKSQGNAPLRPVDFPRPASQPSNPETQGPDWTEAGKLREMMESGKTVLAVSAGQIGLWRALAQDELGKGRSVLVLDSEIGGVESLFRGLGDGLGGRVLLYHSAVSAAARRSVSDRLRSGEPCLVLGTRSALLLPFKSLGLIVLLNEHDPSYKQDVTPRFLGRDLAAVLARIHSARLLLCSATPSLESLANVLSGKYLMFKDSAPADCPPAEIIDTAAEKRKNGMVGNFSRRLMVMMAQTLGRGEKVLLLRTWGDVHFLRDEVTPLFPENSVSCLGDEDYNADAQIVLGTMSQSKTLPLFSIGLVAVMLCDNLFARTDFHADERALQILRQLQLRRSKETENNIVIQTSRSSHPVYQMLSGRRAFSYDEVIKSLLQERRDLGFPPYKRIVDVLVRDTSASRLHLMASRLAATLQKLSLQAIITEPFNAAPWETDLLRIRIVLPRGSETAATKRTIYQAVNAFEKQNSYPSHIHFDVDPV